MTEEKQKIYVVVDRDRLAITNTIAVGATVSVPISTGKRGGKPTRKRGMVTVIMGNNALVAMPGRKPQIVALKDCVVVEK